jgi:hypothetical protein
VASAGEPSTVMEGWHLTSQRALGCSSSTRTARQGENAAGYRDGVEKRRRAAKWGVARAPCVRTAPRRTGSGGVRRLKGMCVSETGWKRMSGVVKLEVGCHCVLVAVVDCVVD